MVIRFSPPILITPQTEPPPAQHSLQIFRYTFANLKILCLSLTLKRNQGWKMSFSMFSSRSRARNEKTSISFYQKGCIKEKKLLNYPVDAQQFVEFKSPFCVIYFDRFYIDKIDTSRGVANLLHNVWRLILIGGRIWNNCGRLLVKTIYPK